MRQQYECLDCKFKMWGERSKHDGAKCPKCKGPIMPIAGRRVLNMDKLDYLLQYLSELGSLLRTLSSNGEDIRVLDGRINRVNDMIERELRTMTADAVDTIKVNEDSLEKQLRESSKPDYRVRTRADGEIILTINTEWTGGKKMDYFVRGDELVMC